jgi:periplasmic glucans biosynthesis protein
MGGLANGAKEGTSVMPKLNRRQAAATILATLAAAGLRPGIVDAREASPGMLDLGAPEPFSFQLLKNMARDRARQDWQPLASPHTAILERIDYDEFNQIAFRREAALWADVDNSGPVQLFHLGRFFREPASIHAVSGQESREIRYRRDYFDMPEDHPARDLPDDIGYAGFRVMAPGQERDWLAFLGASYFRSSGELDQYGLSARGIAVNLGLSGPEEFPRFTAFYLEPAGDDGRIIIHALLEGPSLTGAYRLDCLRDGAVTMDVDCALFIRQPIERLGIAPLTSMFWYGQLDRSGAIDWRPRIHDSEGLAIWAGNGERIWRPLQNPPRVMVNSFLDDSPKGFGLLQRHRDFADFQDDGVFYERRPSLWVEPKGNWGKGSVQLLEIPTNDEIHDNIGAYWVSDTAAAPGDALEYGYRLYWVADEPFAAPQARVVNGFSGRGGVPGRPRPEGVTRFVVDFEGPALDGLSRGDLVPDVAFSRGALNMEPAAYPVARTEGRWRAYFDLKADGAEPVDLRLVMRDRTGAPKTETWIYQFFPERS